MFLATKDAGHTEKGVSYEARWKDDNNNTNCRQVPRCKMVSKYFGECNRIDSHNQSRQHDLKLEKQWITNDGYFRPFITLIGMTITDCWKGYRHHLNPNHRHKDMGILEFNSILARDLVENYFAQTPESERAKAIDVDDFSISCNQQTPVNVAANVLKEISTMDEYMVYSALAFFLIQIRSWLV